MLTRAFMVPMSGVSWGLNQRRRDSQWQRHNQSSQGHGSNCIHLFIEQRLFIMNFFMTKMHFNQFTDLLDVLGHIFYLIKNAIHF